MNDRSCNVLFLCTGNSARSILDEAILNKIGAGRFRAYSQPKGRVHPQAISLLASRGYDTAGVRSKSWSEFAQGDAPALEAPAPKAPALDFVFTVCAAAAGEACPIWPGHPMTAHWGIPDPAQATGTEAEIARAFADAYEALRQRIEAFIALPLDLLDQASLKVRLREIGQAS